mmetsp:Transcript_46528/g.149454  ORF Transcript_46528/g.149454 Transcript_46528/m.149454 type:complete len:323 (+) Transcript_46528:1683-2651(+)
MPDHDAFRFAGGAGRVHDHGQGVRRGRRERHGFRSAKGEDFIDGHHLVRARGALESRLRRVVPGVDDRLQGRALAAGAELGDLLDVLDVADDDPGRRFLDGLRDGAEAQRRVRGGHGDGLREGAQHRRHPRRRGVLKDEQRVRAGGRLQIDTVGGRLQAQVAKACTKSLDARAKLPVRRPHRLSEQRQRELRSGRHVGTEVSPRAECVLGGIPLEGALHHLVDGAAGRIRTVHQILVGCIPHSAVGLLNTFLAALAKRQDPMDRTDDLEHPDDDVQRPKQPSKWVVLDVRWRRSGHLEGRHGLLQEWRFEVASHPPRTEKSE